MNVSSVDRVCAALHVNLAGDRSILVALSRIKGRALTTAPEMEANPVNMACCNAVMLVIIPFTAFSFIVKAVTGFAEP